MSRTVDELKMERDGTLFYGKPDRWRVDRQAVTGPTWLIERGPDGMPSSMSWVPGWNRRFLAYCEATGGLSPEDTLARDEALYPGGKMCGFLTWRSAKK